MKLKVNSRNYMLAYLGVLSTFGPFVMDMYLSAFPMIAVFFRTSPSMVQLSLTSCTIGLAVGQLIFGTVSDRYGRRMPLLVSMVLFLLSTLGCLFSPTASFFIACRFVHGLAASGGIVLSRSIAADKYRGRELVNMLAVIGTINGVATVASPVCGGVMMEDAGWQGIFWFLFAFGLLLTGGTMKLHESLPESKRQALRWDEVCGRYRQVMKNKPYMNYILQYGAGMGVLFVNLASAPFIMQHHYGLSPAGFSVVFAVNAIAMAIAAGLAARFHTMEQALRAANGGMLCCSLLLGVTFYMNGGFWIYECLIFCLYLMIGIIFTASNALAMDSEQSNAGIASALLGATGYVAGGVVAPLVGVGDILTSTAILFIAGSLCSFICGRKMNYGEEFRPTLAFPFRKRSARQDSL